MDLGDFELLQYHLKMICLFNGIFDYYGKRRFFVADFYSTELKLVIEIDGKIHENHKEYDTYRTFITNLMGIRVIRFTNENTKDVAAFLKRLALMI